MNKIEFERKFYYNDGKTIRVWTIYRNKTGLHVEYGVLGGKLIHKKVTKIIYNDILKTAEKMIHDRKNKGYVENIHDAVGIKTDIHGRHKPMLAKPIRTHIKYPCFIQPKYNGERCLTSYEMVTSGEGMFEKIMREPVMRTRQGNLFHMERIAKFLSTMGNMLFKANDIDIELDGELYVHGERKGFVRKSCPLMLYGKASACTGKPDGITYVIYDLAIPGVPQWHRFNILNAIIAKNSLETFKDESALFNKAPLHIAPTYLVDSEAEAIAKAKEFVEAGFEGGILRNYDAEYEFGKRSFDLVKIKFGKVETCTIIDVVPKPHEPETGIFQMRTADYNYFSGNPTGGFAIRKEYLDNKAYYIGRKAKVTYYERDIGKVPSHITKIEVL